MHKIKTLLLFFSLSLTCFSQLKTKNQNGINKDLYRLNLNDSVKSVVYGRAFYKEDLTAYEIDDIIDIETEIQQNKVLTSLGSKLYATKRKTTITRIGLKTTQRSN